MTVTPLYREPQIRDDLLQLAQDMGFTVRQARVPIAGGVERRGQTILVSPDLAPREAGVEVASALSKYLLERRGEPIGPKRIEPPKEEASMIETLAFVLCLVAAAVMAACVMVAAAVVVACVLVGGSDE